MIRERKVPGSPALGSMMKTINYGCPDPMAFLKHLWVLDLNNTNDASALLYSIQPNLCPDLEFRACIPSFRLRNIVSYYHQVRITGKEIERRIYPTGNIALVFRCDSRRPTAFLVGTPTIPRNPGYIDAGFEYFIVFFQIGEGSALCSHPTEAFVDTHIPLAIFGSDEMEKLTNAIAGSDSFRQRVLHFEHFAEKNGQCWGKTPRHLLLAIEGIRNDTERRSKPRSPCLSDRHTRRLFKRYLGVSPLLFRRIVRHQKVLKALNANPHQDMAELSAELGYCDQPHFIHEFKRFQGTTPIQFIKKNIRHP